MAETPTPALAVPYAAPKHAKTMADVQPIAPKKGYTGQHVIPIVLMMPRDSAALVGRRGGDRARRRGGGTAGGDLQHRRGCAMNVSICSY
jgi:hypothetical protein